MSHRIGPSPCSLTVSARLTTKQDPELKNVEGFFFGEKQQLFGMFHPSNGRPRDHAVVLCPPLFHEYFRAHFALKKIATDLASSGYDVVRFDYSGTGDSKGDLEAAKAALEASKRYLTDPTRAYFEGAYAFKDRDTLEFFLDGLRKAGWDG